MKKFLLGILLGIIISYSVVYAASTLYNSNEVSYTPSDSSWSVGNVKEAIDNLKSTSGNALSNLKNTNIAKAVSANGNSLSCVINTLGGISNKGDLTKTINPGGSVSIAAGYYSGGKISANANQNSGTYTPSAHGTALDMGVNNTYRYVNTTNVWNQAVAAADARTNTASANYKAGYNAGYNACKNDNIYVFSFTGGTNDPAGHWKKASSTTTYSFNYGDSYICDNYIRCYYGGQYAGMTIYANKKCIVNGVTYNAGAVIQSNVYFANLPGLGFFIVSPL